MTVRAIYENGVFRPIKPVTLAEKAEVDVVWPTQNQEDAELPASDESRKDIFEILSHRYRSGQTDTAAAHNEHQP